MILSGADQSPEDGSVSAGVASSDGETTSDGVTTGGAVVVVVVGTNSELALPGFRSMATVLGGSVHTI